MGTSKIGMTMTISVDRFYLRWYVSINYFDEQGGRPNVNETKYISLFSKLVNEGGLKILKIPSTYFMDAP